MNLVLLLLMSAIDVANDNGRRWPSVPAPWPSAPYRLPSNS